MNDIFSINNDAFIKLGAYLYYMAAKKNKDKVTFILPKELEPLAPWAEQLFEESLGKDGKGVTIFYGENLTPHKLKSVQENDRIGYPIQRLYRHRGHP